MDIMDILILIVQESNSQLEIDRGGGGTSGRLSQ